MYNSKRRPLRRNNQDNKMRWFGHILRREKNYIGKKKSGEIRDAGQERERSRPQLRWENKIKDLREKGLRKGQLAKTLLHDRIKKKLVQHRFQDKVQQKKKQ